MYSERQIELCDNSEWLTLYGPLCDFDADDCWHDEMANDWWSSVCNRIESLLGGVEVIVPRGQRRMCHGWNGANTFNRKGGGAGTFHDFTEEEWEQVLDICREEGERVVKEWTEHVAD